MFTLGVKPSDMDILKWQYSLNDFKKIVSLRVQFEIAKASSVTESLSIIASALFPSKDKPTPRGEVQVITDIRSLAGSDKWR